MKNPRYLTAGRLAVEIHADRPALGLAAADAAAAYLHDVIAARGEARVIFACAPSQNEFLSSLIAASREGHTAVDWSRVTAFHMDDYMGLPGTHPQSFRHFLQTHFLSHVKIGRFHPLPAEESDAAAVAARYTALLGKQPSATCCSRHARSSSTTFTSSGSAKSATGGSLKAMWPFSPMPRQMRSMGFSARRAV